MQVGGIQNGSVASAPSVSKGLNFAYYDPRDSNKNGIVSTEEDYTYSLNHPWVDALKRLKTPASAKPATVNQYTQKGALSSDSKTTSSLFDAYA